MYFLEHVTHFKFSRMSTQSVRIKLGVNYVSDIWFLDMARCMLNEVCDLCKSHRPWTSFETENVLPCQQPPDAENQIEFNTELFEIVETRLNKLVLLASGIGYEHLLTTARQFLDKLQNVSFLNFVTLN